MITMTTPSYIAPLAVLDAEESTLVAHLPNVQRVELPDEVTDLATAAEWALAYGLGAAKLSERGEDKGPVLILTESAVARFGLPAELTDRKRLRVPDDDPSLKALAEAGWGLSRAGLSPWSWLFRTRAEVHVGIIPWGAFAEHMRWGELETSDPAALAYTLGLYAERVISPTGSTAGCSTALMEAVHPPTTVRFEPGTGRMKRVPVEGSLSEPVEAAPPEVPDEHPLAADRTKDQAKDPRHVLMEEALAWRRPPTEEEIAAPYVVGLDINVAFLAAANRLTVGRGPWVHTDGPAFDKKLPGTWLVDLSGVTLQTKDLRTKEWIDLDPRLPSPFTPTGEAPTGPAWYSTPTLAYAQELGIAVRPTEAYLRPDCGGYLDLWHNRLRDAYMDTLADLGVTPDMEEEAFLDAMSTVKQRDPDAVALLSAIKQTAKGGIGKLREKPQGIRKRQDRNAPWAALKRPTWRPDIRAMVISAARVGGHRKMVKTWQATGLVPLAVLSDCVVYPSAHPTARAVVPRKPDGAPLPGGFRLGPNPGYCKEEGVRDMDWYRKMIERGAQFNPARFIKEGRDASREGE